MQNQNTDTYKIIQRTRQSIAYLQSIQQGHISQVSQDEKHSGKDYRGIFANLTEVLRQFSGDIPLGYYRYGCPVGDGYGETDVRKYQYLISLQLSELLKGHIRLVGPSRAGKSEFLFKLVVNLAKNYNFSIVWFSTKFQEDKEFFQALFPEHTIISANDIHLTRLTEGRFNPLERIGTREGRVSTEDCRKIAETLIKLIPIENVSGDTEKFMRDVVVRLAGILELLKYCYGNQAVLEQVLSLWVILPKGSNATHPLEKLLSSKQVPAEAQQRLRRILSPLLQPQPAHEASVGPTAQQLLTQIESLAPVLAAGDINNFSSRIRNSNKAKVLVIDQSDGMNSAISKGLAKMVFPLLYEDLVAQCPSNWKDLGMRPVLMVADEMNSLIDNGGREFTDFMEKSLAKGVLMAFGQQSSVGNDNPRLNAAMSNNTRLQVVFSGCDSTDPLVQEMSAVAGRYPAPLEPYRDEEGFGQLERLSVDAVANLGTFNSLIRFKSINNRDRILLVNQANPLIPERQNILNLRFSLALFIYSNEIDDATRKELQDLYRQVEYFLLLSYGYISKNHLSAGYQSLNLRAIEQSYHQTMQLLAQDAQKEREKMRLENSRPEFARNEAFNLSKTLVQWQQEHIRATEAWLWSSFLGEVLPEIQAHQPFWIDTSIKQPLVGWWKGSNLGKTRFLFWEWGEDYPTRVGRYWDAVLTEYQIYAQAFGVRNPDIWNSGVGSLVAWRVGRGGSYNSLGALGRSL